MRLRVSHFFSLFPSLITVIGALEIHKLITVKSPEIKGNKRDLRYSGIDGKNEEYPVHYEVLSGLSLLFSRSGKNRKTEVIARENKYKKTTSCNT